MVACLWLNIFYGLQPPTVAGRSMRKKEELVVAQSFLVDKFVTKMVPQWTMRPAVLIKS